MNYSKQWRLKKSPSTMKWLEMATSVTKDTNPNEREDARKTSYIV